MVDQSVKTIALPCALRQRVDQQSPELQVETAEPCVWHVGISAGTLPKQLERK